MIYELRIYRCMPGRLLEWHKVRAESDKNGPIIANIDSRLLAPTAYSKAK